MSTNWESRWHPLLQQWVVISARSALRPWSGSVVPTSTETPPIHDPDCYLCPRVVRAGGQNNPDYQGPWAFDNDFPSLALNAPDPASDKNHDDLHRRQAATGICRVMCWSEKHNATLATVSATEMRSVVELWKNEFATLSKHPQIDHVMIFENKGREIGVSNLHPHGQIYAMGFVSDSASRMRNAQHQYQTENSGGSLLQNLVLRDEYSHALLIEQSDYFKTIVPFAARLPFETWIVPARHVTSIDELTEQELDDLSRMYQRQAQRYDALFRRSSPNITLLQNAPCDGHPANTAWCFHVAMQPPLRDANTLKYMAGFESGTNNIVNPVQPESAAAALRECLPVGSVH